jgi:hypothetical protein
MIRTAIALTLLAAATAFAPAAQAQILCEDDDGEVQVCMKRLPMKIPRLPSLPVPSDDDDLPQKVERKANEIGVPKAAARVLDGNTKIIEKPAEVRVPEVVPSVPDAGRICRKYFPAVGEMLPVPCDE